MEKRNGIGLVLSGGGTRGIAHVGAWRVLSSLNFRPAVIAGCSMGALVGAMIASGHTVDEIEEFVLAQRATALFQWPITKLGISNLTKFEKRLMAFIGTRRFEGLQIPLIMNATNLTTGERVVYDRGLLWPALRATIAVPGLLAPVRLHGEILVDGGILHEHPFLLLPKEVQRFIMVNCSPRESLTKQQVSVIDLLRASMNVMQNTITEMHLASIPSYRYRLIEPNVHGRNLFESEKQFRALLTLGSEAAEAERSSLTSFIQ